MIVTSKFLLRFYQLKLARRKWTSPSSSAPGQLHVLTFAVQEIITSFLFRQKNTCFNCGGDHVLAQCKLPKDHKRIATAKMEFRSQSMNNSLSVFLVLNIILCIGV